MAVDGGVAGGGVWVLGGPTGPVRPVTGGVWVVGVELDAGSPGTVVPAPEVGPVVGGAVDRQARRSPPGHSPTATFELSVDLVVVDGPVGTVVPAPSAPGVTAGDSALRATSCWMAT